MSVPKSVTIWRGCWSLSSVQSDWWRALLLKKQNKTTDSYLPTWLKCLLLEPPHTHNIAQSYLTLCDPVGCNPPGSSVHGILQARILEWVAISFSISFSSGLPFPSLPFPSSRPRDQTQVSRIAGRRFNLWATREAPLEPQMSPKPLFRTAFFCVLDTRDPEKNGWPPLSGSLSNE